MICPKCRSRMKCRDSRYNYSKGEHYRSRRYVCEVCEHRLSTREYRNINHTHISRLKQHIERVEKTKGQLEVTSALVAKLLEQITNDFEELKEIELQMDVTTLTDEWRRRNTRE